LRNSSINHNCSFQSRRSLRFLVIVVACASLCLPAFALDPSRTLTQYTHSAWNHEQGFFGENIYAISRSADGYLWIGTDTGLVRFDGTGFASIRRPFANLPPIGRVRGLLSDADGVLWILLEDRRLLLYRDGQFSDAFAVYHIPPLTITAISLDQQNRVLFSNISNVTLRVRNGRLEQIAHPELEPRMVVSIAESMDGRIWMGMSDAGLFASAQGRVVRIAAQSGDEKINALAADFNGGLWVGTDHGLYFVTIAGKMTDPLPAWTHQHQVLTLFRDRDDCIWAGTNHGLIRINPAGQASFRATSGNGEVNAVFQDREQNLWYGGPGGLERLQDGVFSPYSAAESVPPVPIGPIFADSDGGIWFAPLAGGLYRYQGGQLRQVRDQGLDHDVVYSIDGRDADVWVGRRSGGLTRIRRHGDIFEVQTFNEKRGLTQNEVFAVHVAHDGTVWSGTVNRGISALRGSGFNAYSTANGLTSNSINSITETSDGHIWIGTPDSVDEFSGGRWINRMKNEGLPSPGIRVCFADSHDVVWIASSEGLSYLSNGHITTPTKLPDALREPILGISEDQLGFLWFSTPDHVLRANRSAIIADSMEAGDLKSYGVSDGLSAFEPIRRERSLILDPSGRIWVSLGRGIASGDPNFADREAEPVHVRLDSVSADGRSVNLSAPSGMPAGTRSMVFHYSGDSLSHPERVRFRYRLEGIEAEWTDAAGGRQALYNNLGPGRHRFHVIASRDGDLWNNPETVYSFVIEPTYWQTWWFRTFGALSVLLSIVFVVRLRSIQLARQLNTRFQERLSERTRIARELHDTMLQSFNAVLLRLQTVSNVLPAHPDEAKHRIDRAIEQASLAIAEGRDAVHELRSSGSMAPDLDRAISEFVREMLSGSPSERDPEVHVQVEGTARPLNPVIRDEVFRIVAEATRNAIRHANARRIEIEIRYDENQLRLRIGDNGTGIDPSILDRDHKAGHWGLRGMRERAKIVGGTLEIWSQVSSGTEIELNIPAANIYAKPPSARWSVLFPFRG